MKVTITQRSDGKEHTITRVTDEQGNISTQENVIDLSSAGSGMKYWSIRLRLATFNMNKSCLLVTTYTDGHHMPLEIRDYHTF